MKFLIKIVVLLVFLLLLTGTISYSYLEGWSYIDALYFTAATITTVGYGDLYPTHDASKIFTVFFILTGVSIAIFSISAVSAAYFEHRSRIARRKRK